YPHSAHSTHFSTNHTVANRHLHSFPTRRSSDLGGGDGRVHVRHGAAPDRSHDLVRPRRVAHFDPVVVFRPLAADQHAGVNGAKQDRKSTRLNSSHLGISYAVFCLKKKKINIVEG